MAAEFRTDVIMIDGVWRNADDGQTFDVINPATEETIAAVAYGGGSECRQAIDSAAAALPSWMKRTAWDRAEAELREVDRQRRHH